MLYKCPNRHEWVALVGAAIGGLVSGTARAVLGWLLTHH
jgi:hypothetical protein